MLVITPRQEELVKFIQSLDENKRHILTITCRVNEPWEIKEHIIENKIHLIPKHIESQLNNSAQSQLELKPTFPEYDRESAF